MAFSSGRVGTRLHVNLVCSLFGPRNACFWIDTGLDQVTNTIQSFIVSLCQTRSSPRSTRWTLYVTTCVFQKTLKAKCISKATIGLL